MADQIFDIIAPYTPGAGLTRISSHPTLESANSAASEMFHRSKWLRRGSDVRIHVRDRVDVRGADGEWRSTWSDNDRFVEYA